MDNTKEYDDALETMTNATKRWKTIVMKYREQKIDDADFEAGHKTYEAAEKVFDAAWAKERSRC